MRIIEEIDALALEQAILALSNGEVIAFATDTVYGLAVDATNDDAVSSLYKIKKRDQEKPIAIFVKNLKMAQEILQFNEIANKIAKKFLPGPLTLILPRKANSAYKISKYLNNDDDFLGFRIVNCLFIKKLLQQYKKPLAVTSANLSGQKDALTAAEVAKYFQNDSILIINDQNSLSLTHSGAVLSSTVLKIDNDSLEIVRVGKIPKIKIETLKDKLDGTS